MPGIGVPRIRFRTPCSRRKVMLKASAVNVVDITLIPAIPGTMMFRSCWLPCKIAPKNARLGVPKNRGRGSRYCRQAREAISAILTLGGELQVHVLERRARDRQA